MNDCNHHNCALCAYSHTVISSCSNSVVVTASGRARALKHAEMVVIKYWSAGRLLVDLVFALLMLAAVVYLEWFAPPYQRGASCADTSLSYPYKPTTVSLANAIVVGSVVIIALVHTRARLS